LDSPFISPGDEQIPWVSAASVTSIRCVFHQA
jgi:hypothetical protein